MIWNISRLHAEIISGFTVYFCVYLQKSSIRFTLHARTCWVIYSLFWFQNILIFAETLVPLYSRILDLLQPYLCMMYTRPNILEQLWLSVNPWSKKSVTWIAKTNQVAWLVWTLGLEILQHCLANMQYISFCSVHHSGTMVITGWSWNWRYEWWHTSTQIHYDNRVWQWFVQLKLLHTAHKCTTVNACLSSEYLWVSSANSRLFIKCFILVIWHWKTKTNTLKSKTHLCVLWVN